MVAWWRVRREERGAASSRAAAGVWATRDGKGCAATITLCKTARTATDGHAAPDQLLRRCALAKAAAATERAEAAEDAMLFSTCWLDLYARPRPGQTRGGGKSKGRRGEKGGTWKATAGQAVVAGESFEAPQPTRGYRMDPVDLGPGPLPSGE